MSIGERLTQERKRLGLSQADFANQVGISLSSQKRYESGKREPDTSYLEGARSLGVDITYLLTDKRHIHKDEWVDEFYMVMFGIAFAKLHGLTKSDLKSAVGFVETTMNNPPYRDLPPEESMPIYDEMFLMSVSDLLNRKSQNDQKNIAIAVDTTMLTVVLDELESALQKSGLEFSPAKKARAAAMLYRSFKSNGVVDKKMVDETIALASS
jgi:DNA-binding XRE family transcriptional regulator